MPFLTLTFSDGKGESCSCWEQTETTFLGDNLTALINSLKNNHLLGPRNSTFKEIIMGVHKKFTEE